MEKGQAWMEIGNWASYHSVRLPKPLFVAFYHYCFVIVMSPKNRDVLLDDFIMLVVGEYYIEAQVRN